MSKHNFSGCLMGYRLIISYSSFSGSFDPIFFFVIALLIILEVPRVLIVYASKRHFSKNINGNILGDED